MPGKWFITNLSSSAGIQPGGTRIGGAIIVRIEYKDRKLHLISEDTRIKEQGYSLGEDIVVERFSLNEDQHNVRGTP